MGGKIQKGLILTLVLLMSAVNLPAQKKAQEDSVVYLMKATSVQLIEKFGRPYRKSVDATFLHNGTYLICDTALWDVDRKVIKAEGHVKVIQGETELTSETLDYIVDEDLAKFRGGVVQLRNKQNNILRTRHLDYNTKDSVAVFKSGGSMKDADGQVIESQDGTYESARKLFTFDKNVNMYTDTTFVKTTRMTYDSGCNKANFTAPIDFWKDDNMLSAGCGWYDRLAELFFFRQRVHGMSPDQEVWCDTLYYHRDINDVLMLGNVQVQDSSRNVAGLADYMYYCDSLDQITMRKRAAVAIETEQNGQTDTLYFGADTLIYRTIPRCDVPSYETDAAKARMDDIMLDPVQEFRRKAAEAARKAAEEAAMNDLNAAGKLKAAEAAKKAAAGAEGGAAEPSGGAAPDEAVSPEAPAEPSAADSLAPAIDSLPSVLDSIPSLKDSIPTVIDTLKARLDSIALADSLARADSLHILDSLAHRDTTKIGFLEGIHNVKMFRTDMQVRCDSLRYTDLDSIARFYINPIVWNEGNRQYTSDSLSVLIKDGGVERASLMSNALILTQEDTCYYDQIKGTDVMAYFDSTSALRRFDALGGASALFFLQENDTYATVNKVESKMLSALMVDGELDRVFYFESPKNDAFPIAQMKSADLKMKGFNWNPEARPTGPWDITTLKVKPLERKQYSKRAKPVFKQTDIYFPGYMDKVYKELEARKNRPKSRPASKPAADSLAVDAPDSLLAAPDSLAAMADSTLSVADSLASGALAAADSLSATVDSLSAAVGNADSTAVSAPQIDPKVLKAQQRKEKQEAREEARKLRIAARDARWAELDARDAAKAEARKQKELSRKREKTKKLYLKQSEQDSVDNARLQKYIERYEKQKAAHERKQQSVAARKRASRIEKRGDIPPAPES